MKELEKLMSEVKKVENRNSIVKEYDKKPTKFEIPTTFKHYERNCIICNDLGYTREIIDGYAYDKKCECVLKKERERAILASGLKEKFDTNRLDNFTHKEDWESTVYKTAVEYIDNPKGSYMICGIKGSGKTHICTAICKGLLDNGCKVKYAKYNLLFKYLVKVKNSFDITLYEKELFKYIKIDILYIDDLFKLFCEQERKNLDVIFDLIDGRYSQNKRTIFSSEMSLDEIDLIDGAIAGRIKEMCGRNYIYTGNDPKRNKRLKK